MSNIRLKTGHRLRLSGYLVQVHYADNPCKKCPFDLESCLDICFALLDINHGFKLIKDERPNRGES